MNIEHWPPPAEDNPFHIMALMKGRMFSLVQSRFEAAGMDLDMEGFIILMHVRQDGGIHQTRLAETIGRDKPSVTRALDVLERRAWLRRSVDPEDRRSHCLAITTEGERALNAATPLVHEIIASFFDPISDADYQVFLSVLRTLCRQLDTLEA